MSICFLKKFLKCIVEIGPLTYTIMYGLLFYSVSEDQMKKWQTPTTDYLLIKRVSVDISMIFFFKYLY